MVLKLLRRLARRSASASRAGEPLAGPRPGGERRDRSGAVGNPLPSDWVKMQVWRRDHGKCVYCGSQEKVWFDYIVPVEEGGSCTEANIRLLCRSCSHRIRGASTRRRNSLGA
jgi:hypothetical protein